MRISFIVLVTLLVCLATGAPLARAADDIATMAGIVLSLQHFPSDADKEKLAAIAASDAADTVKTVANAIANIQHSVSDADKAALEAIADDESQSADLRELAFIVAELNHVPSAEDKASLAELAGM